MDNNKIFVFDFETTGLPPKDPKTRKRLDVTESTYLLFPRAVQVSALLYDVKTKSVENTLNNLVLLGDDVVISEDAIDVHGITREMTKASGISIKFILDTFFKMLEKANTVIAHNIAFDVDVLKTEIFHFFTSDVRTRNKLLRVIAKKVETGYCTMDKTTNLCKLPFEPFTKPTTEPSLSPPSTSLLPASTTLSRAPFLSPIPTTLSRTTTLSPAPSLSPPPSSTIKKIYKWPKLTELHFFLFGYTPENLHDAKTDCLVCLKCYLFITLGEQEEKESLLQSEFSLLGI